MQRNTLLWHESQPTIIILHATAERRKSTKWLTYWKHRWCRRRHRIQENIRKLSMKQLSDRVIMKPREFYLLHEKQNSHPRRKPLTLPRWDCWLLPFNWIHVTEGCKYLTFNIKIRKSRCSTYCGHTEHHDWNGTLPPIWKMQKPGSSIYAAIRSTMFEIELRIQFLK